MTMRLFELEAEEYYKQIINNTNQPKVLELTNPRILEVEPIIKQSEFDELPQKIKHRKKRKFHN